MTELDIIVPLELEGTKSVVRTWLKQPGEPVVANEPIVELETDKVAMEVFAPGPGVLGAILLPVGEPAEPGAVLGRLSAGPEMADAVAPAATEPSASPAAAPAPQPAPPAPSPAARLPRSISDFDPDLKLSPAVRRMLMESGADPRRITGTGRDGRIRVEDVQTYLAGPAPPAAPVGPREPAREVPSATPGASRLVPHDAMRLSIAEHMSRSLATAPHVTAVFEADFGAIMAHRQAHKAGFAAQGVSLTYTAYLVAACVEAMKAAPSVNSRWRDEGLEVFDDVNVAVGTALGDRGLVAPVVRRAQSLSLFGIAERLQEMTQLARSGKLRPADVQGGTFSISNHGVSGSLLAAPIIINQPQSAILGVGKLEKRVVVREQGGADVIAIRPMAYVSLSIDHRAIDGHQTNAWLTRFVETLERWPDA